MNGALEMDGFKGTFSDLYGYNGTTGNTISGNFSADFDIGSGVSAVCSSGNGAGSDVMIVS